MSYFAINLHGFNMTEDEVETLNSELRETTLKYLRKIPEGKKYLENSVELGLDSNGSVLNPGTSLNELTRLHPINRFPHYFGFFPIHKNFLRSFQKQVVEIKMK